MGVGGKAPTTEGSQVDESRWTLLVAVLTLVVNTIAVIQNRKRREKYKGRHRR